LALLGASAFSATAEPTKLPTPPHVVPVPLPPDINSEEFQQQLARKQSAALKKAARARQNVTRIFIVGWEMHHGIFLVPRNSITVRNWFLGDWVAPDFEDDTLADRFEEEASARVFPAGAKIPHLGQRLICRCTGVPWRFYSEQRFLVRSAKLEWQ
jgi:hypothetical protein